MQGAESAADSRITILIATQQIVRYDTPFGDPLGVRIKRIYFIPLFLNI